MYQLAKISVRSTNVSYYFSYLIRGNHQGRVVKEWLSRSTLYSIKDFFESSFPPPE